MGMGALVPSAAVAGGPAIPDNRGMRWEGLFADLEAQAAALETAERAAEVAERARAEVAGQRLRERLRAALGTGVRLRCVGGVAVAGVLRRVGPDWLLVDEGEGRECLVALAGVLAVGGVTRLALDPGLDGVVAGRLRLAHALRGLVRDRAAVRLWLVDGGVLAGTLDRVGADFVDLAVHPVGEARRREEVRDVQVTALAAVVAVRPSG